MKRRVAFLDVFAERPLAGNGLAVVDDADGVDEDVMHAFARETRLSETTFVQTATEGGADYRNRIWVPGGEIPFAGHPSLGTAVSVARWRGVSEAAYVQQTVAGLQPIEVSAERSGDGDERWRASMLQGPAELGTEVDRGEAMEAAGLSAADADPELPPQFASTGFPAVLAPVVDADALERVSPEPSSLARVLESHGAAMLYLFCRASQPDRFRARMFSPGLGSAEDPATGSAVGPLCAYLAEHTGTSAITVDQGVEMGRPSLLRAEIEEERIRVSGSVIPLIDGTVDLP